MTVPNAALRGPAHLLSPRAQRMACAEREHESLIAELCGAVHSLIAAMRLDGGRRSDTGERYCPRCSSRMDRTHTEACPIGKALAVLARAEGKP